MIDAPTQQNLIKMILLSLGFPAHQIGYRLLCIAIPYYALHPGISVTKELYPYLAKLEKCSVESAIRRTIQRAWKHGDPNVWSKYFPNSTECPSNFIFIATLAEYIK